MTFDDKQLICANIQTLIFYVTFTMKSRITI